MQVLLERGGHFARTILIKKYRNHDRIKRTIEWRWSVGADGGSGLCRLCAHTAMPIRESGCAVWMASTGSIEAIVAMR